jgi:hypothetical protein
MNTPRKYFSALVAVTFSAAALSAVACGGSKKNTGVMTPQERLEEQLRIAEEQKDLEDRSTDQFSQASTVDEEEAQFDEESATHELNRASLNAVDCPNTFEKDQLGQYTPGTANVTLTFTNTGEVKDVAVTSPYNGTPVGDCIIRAMGTVRVEPFQGAEVHKTWELQMEAPKPREPAKK